MAINLGSVVGVPLLESGSHGGEKWWGKLLDMKEARDQILLSFPMILTNVFYFTINLVSVMFAGHLGQLELAGATLANSWATVSGFAVMTGLSGALETLCGQGFGAKEYRMLGIHLQASCLISFFSCAILSVLWLYTESILISLHQNPEIAETAATYIRHLIPGLFAFGFLQNMLRFLQTQSVVMPLVWFSGIPMLLHFGIIYLLVGRSSGLGFRGAAMAASISLWISFLLLAIYVARSKRFEQTWCGFSLESFGFAVRNLELALPSAAMVCLEEWAFELLVILAGLMPNSEISTSLTAMCMNTETVAFMVAYGLSATVSTRVSNELGAGNPGRARSAMIGTVKLSILMAILVISILALGNHVWAAFFSGSLTITMEFSKMTSLLAISIPLDFVQGVLSGVARGCGQQRFVVYGNLATFYFIGMPIAIFLGFQMQLYAKGLWIGLICGMIFQASALVLITVMINWTNLRLYVGRCKSCTDSIV